MPAARTARRGDGMARLDAVVVRLASVCLWATAAVFGLFTALLVWMPAAAAVGRDSSGAVCAGVVLGEALAAALAPRWPQPMRGCRRPARPAGHRGRRQQPGHGRSGPGDRPGRPARGAGDGPGRPARRLRRGRIGAAAGVAAGARPAPRLVCRQRPRRAAGADRARAVAAGRARRGRWLAGGARWSWAPRAPPTSASSASAACCALSADAYWELDAHLRLSAVTHRTQRPPGAVRRRSRWARCPGSCRTSPATRRCSTACRPTSGRARPFRDVPIAWQARDGLRHFLISGEPRLDARRRLPRLLGRGARRQRRPAGAAGAGCAPSRATTTCSSASRRRWCCTATGASSTPTRRRWICSASTTCRACRAATCSTSTSRGDSRERARGAPGSCRRMPPGEALPVSRVPRCSAPGGRLAIVRATGVARRDRARPRRAVDLRRRHRAPGGRRRGAPLRGAAVAPGGQQPGRDHAHRAGQRPLRDGQPPLRSV